MAELRDAGCLILALTGGEVLTYPHLFAVLDRARELNLAVQLLTNGTMLQPGRRGAPGALPQPARRQRQPLRRHGRGPRRHHADPGLVPAHVGRRRSGMRAAGVAVRLKFIVMRQNAHEVADMRAQADARGFPYLVDVTITARHDGTRGSLATRVDEEQLAELYRGPAARHGARRGHAAGDRGRASPATARAATAPSRRRATSSPACRCRGPRATCASSRSSTSGGIRPCSRRSAGCASPTTRRAPPAPTSRYCIAQPRRRLQLLGQLHRHRSVRLPDAPRSRARW